MERGGGDAGGGGGGEVVGLMCLPLLHEETKAVTLL